MRATVSVVATVIVIGGGAVWLQAMQSKAASAGASPTCSSSTLRGTYGFISQTRYPDDAHEVQGAFGQAGKSIVSVGRMEFDGKGGWRSSYTAALADGRRVSETKDGSYAVDADCFGTFYALAEKGGTRFQMVTEAAGRELRFIGGRATGTAFRQDAK